MSAVVSKKKRDRQPANQAPACHSGAGRNPVTGAFNRSASAHSHDQIENDLSPSLPKGWRWATLGTVCSKPQYGWTTSAVKSGDVKLLRTTDITHGPIDWSAVPFCRDTPQDVEKHLLEEGDIVVSRAGSVGFSARVVAPERAVFASYLIRFRPKSDVDGKYLEYFMQSPAYWTQVRGNTAGIAVPNVNASQLEAFVIPLAPGDQQKAIVAEIEKQFTRLDAGVAALRRVQANLKRYRAAVLKAACEGRLVPTEAELAKAEGRNYETGEQLLARILADRRKNWHGRGKYKEPAAPDTTNLPPLPEGWVYTSIDPLLDTNSVGMKTGPFGSLLKKSEHKDSGVPVIGIENIGANGRFVHGSKIYVTTQKAHELAAYELLVGDVVISRSGTVGELCVIPESVGTARFSTNIMMVRLAPWCSSTYFCFLFAGSPIVLDQIKELCKGSTREFLNQHILKSIIFPLPPFAEQLRIVAEVERHLSVIEELEAAFTATLQRATSLRQSVLQRAFSTPATKAHPA
jgi:type I restriction enzyme S subunit